MGPSGALSLRACSKRRGTGMPRHGSTAGAGCLHDTHWTMCRQALARPRPDLVGMCCTTAGRLNEQRRRTCRGHKQQSTMLLSQQHSTASRKYGRVTALPRAHPGRAQSTDKAPSCWRRCAVCGGSGASCAPRRGSLPICLIALATTSWCFYPCLCERSKRQKGPQRAFNDAPRGEEACGAAGRRRSAQHCR